MSIEVKQKPQFRGFTNMFKRLNGEKEDKQSAGKVDPSEYALGRSADSQKVVHPKPPSKSIQQEESPPVITAPPLRTYEEWFAERINIAVARCRNIYGPIREETEDVHKLANKIRYSSANNPKTAHNQPCHCVDCEVATRGEAETHKRSNIYQYPQDYQFDMLNRRLQKLLTFKHDPDWLHKFVEKNVLDEDGRSIEDEEQRMAYDRLASERKELTRLLNKKLHLPPNKKLDFRRENFADWHARFLFNFDKKYKCLPKVTTREDEDFRSWLEKAEELAKRKPNHEERIKLQSKLERVASGVGDADGEVSQVSLNLRKPSLSLCHSDSSLRDER